MQCCLWCSRQHCIRKNVFNVVLILFGKHFKGKNHVKCCSKSSQHCIVISTIRCCLNTSETTFHMKITCAMLAQSTQLSFRGKITCKISSWSNLDNIAQENFQCNIDPHSINKFPQDNNLRFCLYLSGTTLHKGITCAMLAHDQQTTFMWKITYTMLV